MLRRDILLNAFAATSLSVVLPVQAQAQRTARLLIVGGAEDRQQDRVILRKFIEYTGGPLARIRLITAASGAPEAVAESYRQAFGELAVQNFEVLPLQEREQAFDPQVLQSLQQADGVFMSGGDQSRLMATIWETPVLQALHQAFHFRGCCIGGTSAGAAVMSRHMIAQGPALLRPRKDAIATDIGLGLLPAAIVDQHFSERRRLARLLSVLAQRPDLLGVGIDEDTALVVERGQAIEVIGQGMVTLVDPSKAVSNLDELEADELIELLGVTMHTLPAGHRYPVQTRAPRHWPTGLHAALQRLVRPGPVRA